jgi:hypothetical protein
MEKIDRFPVGRAFSTKQDGHQVKYGWVIGYGLSPSGELVFRVRWAHRDEEQLLHPVHVHSVLTDYAHNAKSNRLSGDKL